MNWATLRPRHLINEYRRFPGGDVIAVTIYRFAHKRLNQRENQSPLALEITVVRAVTTTSESKIAATTLLGDSILNISIVGKKGCAYINYARRPHESGSGVQLPVLAAPGNNAN